MSFATPSQAAAWLALTAGGALATADPTPLASLGDVGPLGVALLSTGLVGSAILDRLRGRESDESGSDDDGLDSLMGEGGLDDGDALDDMGDMDDWGDDDDDDPFGGMGGDDGDTDELEHRLDELEGEVGSLSSTVGTVRSENEEIANQVEEVSENVRKLLDIYEMVTRGINPFVDDVAAGGIEEGSLGLFDGDEEESEEELDEDIANADAAGFFDEDLAEEEPDDGDELGGFDDDEFGGLDDDGEFGGGELDEEGAAFAADPDGADGDGTGVSEQMETEITDDEGKSFAELKAEYDSGDADWVGDGDPPEPDAEAEEEAEVAPAPAPDAEAGGEPEAPADGLGGDATVDDLGEFDDGLAADDGFAVDEGGSGFDDPDGIEGGVGSDTGFESASVVDDAAPEADADPSPRPTEPEPEPPAGADRGAPGAASHDGVDDDWTVADGPDDSGFQFVEDEESDEGKPYLTALPSAYVADLVVMEWLEYLVDESDPTDAARAVRYYESIDWISATVEEDLLDFLVGFGEIDEGEAVRPGTAELSRSHHTRSLSYINRLDGADAESFVVDRWSRISEGPDGI